MVNQNEETWPQILRNVWNLTARALRVVPQVNDGANYFDISGEADGSLNVNVISGSISLTSADGAILDGVNPTIRATVLDLTNSNPLTAAIVDASGDQITSFGGGTQYDEGAIDTTITGTAAMWEDTSDTLRAISMAKPLPVQPGTSATFPVSAASLPLPTGAATSALQTQPGVDIGDVTVNNAAGAAAVNIQDGGNIITVDGTLNATIPGVALEAGNLALVAASLAIMDDWDDGSDRAKVTGSAGMAALVCTMGSVAVAGSLTVTMGSASEATFGSHESLGVNLTSTTAWTLALATPGNPWRIIEVINTTDVDIQVSSDASNSHWKAPPVSSRSIDLWSNGLKISSALSIRNDGSAPSRGNVHVHGITT